MKIYQLRHSNSVNHIYAVPSHDDFVRNVLRNISGLEPDAEMPPFQLADPDKPVSKFCYLSASVLAFTSEVRSSQLGHELAVAGNIYRSTITDTREDIFILSIRAFYDCLDVSKTLFKTHAGGSELGVDHRMGIVKPEFHPSEIGPSSIFKLPKRERHIYIASRPGTVDFYTLYHESGLTDLEFELVWEND